MAAVGFNRNRRQRTTTATSRIHQLDRSQKELTQRLSGERFRKSHTRDQSHGYCASLVSIVNCHARWLAFASQPVCVVAPLSQSHASQSRVGSPPSRFKIEGKRSNRAHLTQSHQGQRHKASPSKVSDVPGRRRRRPPWYRRCSSDECPRDESASSVPRIDQILYSRPSIELLDEAQKDGNGSRQGCPVNRVVCQQSPLNAVVPPR
jgi:hypothetical protein